VTHARQSHGGNSTSNFESIFLRLGSVPDESGYQIASGGVALPNGWKLLFGEAIRRNSAPGVGGSQPESLNLFEAPKGAKADMVISPTEGWKLSRLLEKYRLLSGEMNLLNFMDSGQDAGTPAGA